MAKLGELAGRIGGNLVSALSAATTGAAGFFLDLFVTVWDIYYETIRAPVVEEEEMHKAQEATA